MTTKQFHVPEVSCQHCVNAITKEVSALPGVERVDVALSSKLVTVEHGPEIDTIAIVAAINEAGYDQVEQITA